MLYFNVLSPLEEERCPNADFSMHLACRAEKYQTGKA